MNYLAVFLTNASWSLILEALIISITFGGGLRYMLHHYDLLEVIISILVLGIIYGIIMMFVGVNADIETPQLSDAIQIGLTIGLVGSSTLYLLANAKSTPPQY